MTHLLPGNVLLFEGFARLADALNCLVVSATVVSVTCLFRNLKGSSTCFLYLSLSLSLAVTSYSKGNEKTGEEKEQKHKTQEEGCSKYLQSGRGVKSPYSAFVFDCSTL